MKKLILLLLLIPSLAWGQVSTSGVSLSGCSSGGASAAAYSFACTSATSTANTSGVFCEDFDNPSTQDCNTEDGLNCRAVWSGTTEGTPVFNYDGDTGHGLQVDGTGGSTQSDARVWTEGTNDPEYIYFTVKFTTLASDVPLTLQILDILYGNCASDLHYAHAYWDGSNWKFGVESFAGTKGYTTTTITTNTTYHVWIKTVHGSSNDAAIYLMFNTSATPPTDWATCEGGSPHASCAKSVNGTRYQYADCIRPTGKYVNADRKAAAIFDNFVVSSSVIGSNP